MFKGVAECALAGWREATGDDAVQLGAVEVRHTTASPQLMDKLTPLMTKWG